jgi:hypothetical protein
MKDKWDEWKDEKSGRIGGKRAEMSGKGGMIMESIRINGRMEQVRGKGGRMAEMSGSDGRMEVASDMDWRLRKDGRSGGRMERVTGIGEQGERDVFLYCIYELPYIKSDPSQGRT